MFDKEILPLKDRLLVECEREKDKSAMTESPARMSITLEGNTFAKRIALIQEQWSNDASTIAKCGSVLVVVGNPSEQTTFQKSSVLHSWLLGYEFTDTLILLTKDGRVAFLTSPKKCTILESLAPAFPLSKLVLLKKAKDGSNLQELFGQFAQLIRDCGTSVGVLEGETVDGPTINEWKSYWKSNEILRTCKATNVSDDFSKLLASKDANEFKLIENAGTAACVLMKDVLVDDLLSIIDQERKVTHAKIAEKLEKFIGSEVRGESSKWRLPKEIKKDFIDICYSPLVESGGQYTLKPSNQSTAELLHFGTIVCFIGLRYRSYCANVARTFLIEPEKEQETNYAILLKLFQHVESKIQNGASLSSVYEAGKSWLQQHHPALLPHLSGSFGHGIGIEFKESTSSIAPGNSTLIRPGMTFNLSISLLDLVNVGAKDSKSSKYSLLLADTVGLSKDGSFVSFTSAVPKAFKEVSYFFKSEEDNEAMEESSEQEEESTTSRTSSRARSTGATRSSRYSAKDLATIEKTQRKRKEHQMELAQRNIDSMLDKYSNKSKTSSETAKSSLPQYESYKKDIFLPKETKELKIYVDKRNDTLIFPIMGLAVPFHISTIKNASKSDEGEYTYLRVNFNNPTLPNQQAESTNEVSAESNLLSFIRSVTFRSTESARIAEVLKDINELRRLLATREIEKKDLAELVKQDSLVEIKGRRPHRITDVYIRPSLEGKRHPGEIEIHSNGLRYKNQLKSDQRVDILFDNIQHFFFQPCDDEMIVAVHCHLKNYIMIGKKKTKDVQFYREALEASADETTTGGGSSGFGGRRRKVAYGDEDEIMQEQEDRKRRIRLNEEFKAFAEKVSEQSNHSIEVDMPIRELGFFGVPGRQNVYLMPTKECLVHLTDPPFTVVPLSEVEFASFERVVFSVKNFDLAFVFKDHKQAPLIITSIPAENLESLKDWLDSMDILYAESKINLNWTNIVKAINDDPVGFYESGGWDFLKTENVESDEDEDEDEEDAAYSESEPDYSEDESDEDEEEEEEEEESDLSDESDYASDSDNDDEEDAPDWEELEKEAEREDHRARMKQQSSSQSSSTSKRRK